MAKDRVTELLEHQIEVRQQMNALQAELDADAVEIADIKGGKTERTVEEHLVAIAPLEGFELTDITDDDRRQIAKVVLDAYLLGTGWLTRDDDHGFKREDPLRVEVRDRRVV